MRGQTLLLRGQTLQGKIKDEKASVIGCLSNEKKKPAAPYSRTGESRTTLGEGALNFRVRNGNGCDNSSMATGKKPQAGC